MSEIRHTDIAALRVGCAVLGSGGGGDVEAAALLLDQTLNRRPVPLISPGDLPPDAPCALVGAVGSPTVMVERIPSEAEFVRAVRSVERYLDQPLAAVAALEIGGVNGILGINTAAHLGLPLLDADAMGRALPRLDQLVTFGSTPLTPLALAQPTRGVILLDDVADESVEHAVRAVLPALGTWAAVCLQPNTASGMRRHAVQGSVSRALTIGAALIDHSTGAVGAEELAERCGLKTLWRGVVAEAPRRYPDYEVGTITMIDQASDETARVDFAQEYVAAMVDGELLAGSPDIVVLLDERSRYPVAVDRVRIGQRLRIATLAAPPELVAAAPRLGVVTIDGGIS